MIDKKFFKKYQKQLVWFINTKIGRWFFCVEKDIQNIHEVLPNALSYNKKLVRFGKNDWRWQQTTCFRTHNKYALLINHRLRYFQRLGYLIPVFLKPELGFAMLMFMPLTVTTFYPDAGTNGTASDGSVQTNQNYPVGVDWSTLQGGAGDTVTMSSAIASARSWHGGNTDNKFTDLLRSIFCFDTSSIDDAANISNTIFSVEGVENTDPNNDTPSSTITNATPSSNTNFATSDFTQVGTTEWTDTRKTYADFSTSGYNDYTFNATGIAGIEKSGITRVGFRNANYDLDNVAPNWDNASFTKINIYFSDQDGTANDPKLVVTYTTVTDPTVTTQDATDVQQTTCTGNGNITDTGGENCTRRGFCYMEGTSGDPTTANSVAYDDGDFGTGAYTKEITGLTAGTDYRVRAYAVNSAGTGYGTTVQVTTEITRAQTIQAKARIQHSDIAKTVQAKGRIKTTPVKTIQSKARIKATLAKTIQTKADIKQTDITKTIQAKARVQQTETKTIQSKAQITKAGLKTIQAKATIKQFGVDQTVQSKAAIKQSDVDQTIQAKARLKQTESESIQSKARIKDEDIVKTIQAKAQIDAPVVKTIKAKANIKKLGVAQTVQSKANIKGVVAQTIQAKANLWAFRAGYVRMRSRDQEYPITLNSDKDFNKLRSVDQEYPITLKDNRIL